MTIIKTPIQRTITISIGVDGQVTHAWQQTSFVVSEDGVEISRGTSGQENIEPADLGGVVPQADLLRQIADLKADVTALAQASTRDIAERDAKIAALTTAHEEVNARNAAAVAALRSAG